VEVSGARGFGAWRARSRAASTPLTAAAAGGRSPHGPTAPPPRSLARRKGAAATSAASSRRRGPGPARGRHEQLGRAASGRDSSPRAPTRERRAQTARGAAIRRSLSPPWLPQPHAGVALRRPGRGERTRRTTTTASSLDLLFGGLVGRAGLSSAEARSRPLPATTVDTHSQVAAVRERRARRTAGGLGRRGVRRADEQQQQRRRRRCRGRPAGGGRHACVVCSLGALPLLGAPSFALGLGCLCGVDAGPCLWRVCVCVSRGKEASRGVSV